MKKIKIVSIIVLSLITLCLLVLGVQQTATQNKLEKQLEKLQSKTVEKKSKVKTTTPINTATTIQLAAPLVDKFFTEYHTWNNSKDYRARTTILKGVASADVLKNPHLFSDDDDIDVSGANYIDTAKLHSKAEEVAYFPSKSDDKSTSGLVYVKFTSEAGTLGEGEAQILYEVKYNRLVNLLTTVTYLGKIYSLSDSTVDTSF